MNSLGSDCAQKCARSTSSTSLRHLLFSPPRRLIGAAFVVDLCCAMTSLAVQNLGIFRLNAPPIVLGLLPTAGAVTYTVGCLVSGSISDRFGRRRCAVAGCVGVAASWWVTPHLGSWEHVLVAGALSGAFLSLFWPALQAWLAESTEGGRRELTRNLGLFNISWCLGFMIGPVVTGYLWDIRWPLTFYLPVGLVLALVVVLVLTPQGQGQVQEPETEQAPGAQDGVLFLWLARIGNFVAFFATSIIMSMFPKLGVTLRFTSPQIGWVLFAHRAAQLLLFVITRYEHRWQFRACPLVASQLFAASGMLLAAGAVSVPAFCTGFFWVGACTGIAYVSSLFYALHTPAGGRGQNSGIHEAFLGAGGFLGSLTGGAAAQLFTMRAPFIVGMAMLLVGTCAQLALIAWYRRGR